MADVNAIGQWCICIEIGTQFKFNVSLNCNSFLRIIKQIPRHLTISFLIPCGQDGSAGHFLTKLGAL